MNRITRIIIAILLSLSLVTLMAPASQVFAKSTDASGLAASAVTLSATKTPSTTWSNTAMTVTVTASAPVAHVYCKGQYDYNDEWIDGGTRTCTYTTRYSQAVQYYAIDLKGISIGTASKPYSLAANIDTEAPDNAYYFTETTGLRYWDVQYSIKQPTFTWVAPKDYIGGGRDQSYLGATSGIKGYYIYFGTVLNSEPTQFITTNKYTAPNPINMDGTYIIIIRTVDNAGNVSGTYSQDVYTYTHDITPPTPGTATLNTKDPTSQYVDVVVSAGEDTQSGVKLVRCGLNSVVPEFTGDAHTCVIRLAQNGIVYFQTEDNVGNKSSIGSISVSNINDDAPRVSFLTYSVKSRSYGTNIKMLLPESCYTIKSSVKYSSVKNKVGSIYLTAAPYLSGKKGCTKNSYLGNVNLKFKTLSVGTYHVYINTGLVGDLVVK